MLKIAVIFESCPFDRKGLFNAVHNRVKHLVVSGECEVDVFCVHSRDNALTRRLRHTQEVPFEESVTVEGICYRLLWYRFSILDHIAVSKLHRKPLFFQRFVAKVVGLLKGYDRLVAHSFTGALLAATASALRYRLANIIAPQSRKSGALPAALITFGMLMTIGCVGLSIQ